MNGTRLLVASLAASTAVALVATPALAVCAFDDRPFVEQLADAPVAFVGRVVAVDATGAVADFAVDETWRGGPLPEQVRVHGGSGDPGVITSLDRTWQRGERYLVAPFVEAGRFTDNTCSLTRPVDAEVEAARPADAEAVSSAQEDRRASTVPWILVGLAVLIAASGSTVAVARHRRATQG